MGELISGDESRGQLLVITALALAVLLSALTLTLNTAVFGEVYVAQTDDGLRAEQGALQYQNAVRRGVAGVLPRINNNDSYAEYKRLYNATEAATRNWSGLAAKEYARDSVATNASLRDVSYRTRIVQNESGDFADQSGNTSWTVAEDVSDVHGYDTTVSDDGDALVETGNCTGGCFALAVEGTNGSTWRLSAHDEDDDDDVDLTVLTANGTSETWDTGTGSVAINVTDGTTDGGREFTSFRDDPNLDPPYTLTYANANNVSGTYELIVEGRLAGTIGVDGTTGDSRYGTTGSPRLDPRVVAANVTTKYRSADLTYRSEIRVTPGESDD